MTNGDPVSRPSPSYEDLTHPSRRPPTEAEVREMLGIDPNDPNVTVRIVEMGKEGDGGHPHTETRFDEILSNVYDHINMLGTEDNPSPEMDVKNKIMDILFDVNHEVHKARSKHGSMTSPHEGSAVIREEFEELWDEIKADRGLQKSARQEAIQLAAMAVRYVLDLDPK